ncbi:MAG: hypothetical protein R2939_05300 [Kofleriaceae bacterium]
MRRAARLLVPMTPMPVLGVWYWRSCSADSRGWVLGGLTAMTMFLGIAGGAPRCSSAAKRGGRPGVASPVREHRDRRALLALAAPPPLASSCARRAGKPYTIRGVLFSTSMTPAEVAARRVTGAVGDAADDWPLRDAERYPMPTLAHGARVVRPVRRVPHDARR